MTIFLLEVIVKILSLEELDNLIRIYAVFVNI